MPNRHSPKLRIRQDVMFSESSGGVFFSDSTQSFEIQAPGIYKLFTAVHPFLDGSVSEKDLEEQLAPEPFRRLQTVLTRLRELGLIRLMAVEADHGLPERDIERFADQIGLLAHYSDTPLEAFARFRRARVAVVGGGEFAETIAHALADNGVGSVQMYSAGRPDAGGDGPAIESRPLPTEPSWAALHDPDVVVTAPTRAGMEWMNALTVTPSSMGGALLPVWAFGDLLAVGPGDWARFAAADPEPATGWKSAALALSHNRSSSDAAVFWARFGQIDASPAALAAVPAMQRMAGEIAAYELFRAITGMLPPETHNQVLIQDCRVGEVKAHPVLPSRYLARGPIGSGVDVQAEPFVPPVGSTPEASLISVSGGVDATTGILLSFQDEDLMQSPVKVSVAVIAPDLGTRREVFAPDLWNTAGARRRAAFRALAIVQDSWCAPAVRSTGSEPRRRVDRALLSALGVSLSTTPRGAEWCTATSITTSEVVLVPAAAVFSSSAHNAGGLYRRGPAGIGIGETISEALYHARQSAAVLEVLLLPGGRGGARAVSTTDFASREWTFLAQTGREDTGLEIGQFGIVDGFHVVGARVPAPDGPAGAWSFSAREQVEDAAVEAATEALALVQVHSDGRPDLTSWGEIAYPSIPSDRAGIPGTNAPVAATERAGTDRVATEITSPELRAMGLVAIRVLPIGAE
jgi:hypothetical protein